MKRLLLIAALALPTAAHPSFADDAAARLTPSPSYETGFQLVLRAFDRHAYRGPAPEKVLASAVLAQYLKDLDTQKMIFTQAEVQALSRPRHGEDPADLDIQTAFTIYDLYERRLALRLQAAQDMLKPGFDFTVPERHDVNRSKAAWAANETELRELWRKRVKNDVLQLRLTGIGEADALALLRQRYTRNLETVRKSGSADVFGQFVKALGSAYDPGSGYYPPVSETAQADLIKHGMVGVGLALQDVAGFITVREMVKGGPAAESGQLNVGDRIIGVADGENAVIANVIAHQVDDVIEKMRGTANTTVVLEVLAKGQDIDHGKKLVALNRRAIRMDEMSAAAITVNVQHNGKRRNIGVITLPTFYLDFEARRRGEDNYKSSTRDVAALLAQLHAKGVDDVILDLRNNGGGPLMESISIAGLFLPAGPVMVQVGSDGKQAPEFPEKVSQVWTGSVAVLINRGSAGASEVVAAAIQDRGRGLVLGDTSFGLGSVGTIIDLNRFTNTPKGEIGTLKFTVGGMYRVNGQALQAQGVQPDIVYAEGFFLNSQNMNKYGLAKPWPAIKAIQYDTSDDIAHQLPSITARHKARIAKDPLYQRFLRDGQSEMARTSAPSVSLLEAERRRELATISSPAKPAPGQAQWSKDVILNEALNIVADQQELAAGAK